VGSRIIADYAHDFQHPASTKLPITYRCQNQGPKKTAETDAIFENVWQMNALADADSEIFSVAATGQRPFPGFRYNSFGSDE
jgi:hypothetical protein